MADYTPDIDDLLPQRAPFIMVDELLYADDTTARSRFKIKSGTPLVNKGYFTAGGLLENMAQTVAAGVGFMARQEGGAVVAGHIITVRRYIIMSLPAIGDELFTEITVQTRIPDIIVISGRVTRDGLEIATCDMKILTSV